MEKCKDCIYAEPIPLEKRNKGNYAKCINRKYLSLNNVTGIIHASTYYGGTLVSCNGRFFVPELANSILLHLKRND